MDPILQGSTPSPSPSTSPSHPHLPLARAAASPQAIVMGITVGAGSVLELSQMALAICDAVLRIEPIEHAARMRVLLSVPAPLLRKLMEAVMQRLPAAEFGRIRPQPVA